MGKIIGIDLGTTNSAMAVMEGGDAKIVANAEGTRTTPSVVAITSKGERLVGQVANRQRVTNPENTITGVKRLIGRRFKSKEVQKDIDLLPYKIVESGDHVKVKMGKEDYSPEEVSAMTLAKLKADAEKYLGEEVTEAVITVPAYFDDSQRHATKDAGKIAGLEVRRIINEPTAAALAYGLDKKGKDEKIAVYDLGGGTFDVSILELGDGVVEVLSTNGDTHLGGEDFDMRIVDHLLDVIKGEHMTDVKKNPTAMQRLKEEAEKAKMELSTTEATEINLPFLEQTDSGPLNFEYTLTRAKLESLVEDLVDQTVKPAENALKDAKLKKGDIQSIILVGGMTRMPLVQKKVEEIFGKKPLQGVNPDEVVAVGAAIQAGVLAGDVKDVLLLDVTPLSLGVETMGGVSTKLIERNTTVPTSKSEVFSTAADNQPQVEIHVLQGEREMSEGNKSLGRFVLDGIPAAPRGTPQIEVTFAIDANGILNVTAKDKGTSKEQSITIQDSGNMSKDDIEKAQKDAEKHADEDKKKKEVVETKNMLLSGIHQGEKMLKDNADKISDEDKKKLDGAIKEAKDVENSDDKEILEKAFNKFSETLQSVGAKMYETAEGDDKSDDKDDKKKTKKTSKAKKATDKAVEGEVVED